MQPTPRKTQCGAKVGSAFSDKDFPHQELSRKIIGCAIQVHKVLGPGYLESIYENALLYELAKQGMQVQRQVVAEVLYDGQVVGEHRADLLVEGQVVLELKCVESLTSKHVAQVISTLKAVAVKVGLLINFNEAIVTQGIQRVVLSA